MTDSRRRCPESPAVRGPPGGRLAIERHLDPRRYTIEPSPATTQCFATKL
ncbi:MAG: hypothetical protein M3Q03_17005 [Chloroflexota bacterium]|nr:hypothetical protein [Chloroflexota bacterium]